MTTPPAPPRPLSPASAAPADSTATSGLTSVEASRRLRQDGPNALGGEGRRGPLAVLLGQFASPLVVILILASLVSIVVGDRVGASVILTIVVGATGILVERLFLKHLRKLDPLYGLLLTFGLAIVIEGVFRNSYGSSGLPYQVPESLQGGRNLGFMFLPNYRAWVIVLSLAVCLATWFAIERTRLGSYLRAATENPVLVRAFGINVPRMVTLTYGFGVGLAALAGVMAAPIYNVSPQMGSDLIIVVFAVVVIGGMGSILGAILTGFTLGIVEGLTKVFFPEASNTVIFVIMAIVLLLRPAGFFGRTA
ncbi:MAG: cation-transporting P-type ATPase [Bryobacteraceae bacterium]